MQKSKNFDNMHKRIVSIILALTFILTFFGCKKSDSVQAHEYPVTIADVTIKKSPEKVVALSDSLADIILALGLETKLVARTDECTQEELSPLPSIGSAENINLDKILYYSPDLILIDKDLDSNISAKLQELSIPVIYLKPATGRDSFIALYKNLGSILAGAQTGNKLGEDTANHILMTLDDINRVIPQKSTVTTACYFFDSNKKIATGDTFASLLIEISGATNIAKSSTGFTIDTNILKISNPSFIFCAENAKNDLLADSTISTLNASKNGNVYEMNEHLMTRQGHTVVDAAIFMAGKMYPELASSNSSKLTNDENDSDQKNNTQVEPDSTESNVEEPQNDQQQESIETNKIVHISDGEVSDNVLKVETRLDELDFMPSKPNNVFDEYTVRAITDFQYINGLDATGEANEKTLDLLFSDNAIPRGEPSRIK